MKPCTIGIPRGLLFYKYEWLWKTFFERLGCRVVVSPETNRAILQAGLSLAVDESCLPVKIFLGHVEWLRGKVDYVLVPSIAALHHDEQACSKFLALYDIVHNTFEDLPLLDYYVNVELKQDEARAFRRMGRRLCRNPWRVRAAYREAKAVQQSRLEERLRAQEERLSKRQPGDLTLLVVAHPYTARDKLFGRPIVDFLRREKVHLIFSDVVDPETARGRAVAISTDVYWTYNKEFLGAIDMYRDQVDGILYVMSFPCGPDSLVIDLCQKRVKDKPSLVLTLDELQGEIGLITRLESFTDILRMRQRGSVLPASSPVAGGQGHV